MTKKKQLQSRPKFTGEYVGGMIAGIGLGMFIPATILFFTKGLPLPEELVLTNFTAPFLVIIGSTLTRHYQKKNNKITQAIPEDVKV